MFLPSLSIPAATILPRALSPAVLPVLVRCCAATATIHNDFCRRRGFLLHLVLLLTDICREFVTAFQSQGSHRTVRQGTFRYRDELGSINIGGIKGGIDKSWTVVPCPPCCPGLAIARCELVPLHVALQNGGGGYRGKIPPPAGGLLLAGHTADGLSGFPANSAYWIQLRRRVSCLVARRAKPRHINPSHQSNPQNPQTRPYSALTVCVR